MKKRIIAFVFCLIVLVSVLVVPSFAYENIYPTKTNTYLPSVARIDTLTENDLFVYTAYADRSNLLYDNMYKLKPTRRFENGLFYYDLVSFYNSAYSGVYNIEYVTGDATKDFYLMTTDNVFYICEYALNDNYGYSQYNVLYYFYYWTGGYLNVYENYDHDYMYFDSDEIYAGAVYLYDEGASTENIYSGNNNYFSAMLQKANIPDGSYRDRFDFAMYPAETFYKTTVQWNSVDYAYYTEVNTAIYESIGEGYTFKDLLFAVVNTPVNTFKSLLNFDFLGYNLFYFITSLVSIALLITIVIKLIK